MRHLSQSCPSPCPVLKIVDVNYPQKGRKNGEILVSISGGSGIYKVDLYFGPATNSLIVTRSGVLQGATFAFSGLSGGTYLIKVTDTPPSNSPPTTCPVVEKIVHLDEKSEQCEDPCAKDKGKCKDKPSGGCYNSDYPCHVESPKHPCKFHCELHKVVQPTCKRNGYIAVRINGGVGPYEISVRGPVHKTISADKPGVHGTNNLPPGEYCVTVTDANRECCREEVTLCVVSAPLLITANVMSRPSCSNDGSIQVTICEGGAPYKVFLNGPVNSTRFIDENESTCPVFHCLPAGNYCINVIDCNQQVEETAVFLEKQVNTMTLMTRIEKYPVCTLESGKICYTIKNGYYPVKVDLLDVNSGTVVQCVCHDAGDSQLQQINGCFDNLYEGNYQVVVTDGCGQQQMADVLLDHQDAQIIIDSVVSKPSCGKTGKVTVTARINPPNLAKCVGPLTFTLRYPTPECEPDDLATLPDVNPYALSYTKTVNVAGNNLTTVTFDDLPPTRITVSDPRCLTTHASNAYVAAREASECWPDLGDITVTVSAAPPDRNNHQSGMVGCRPTRRNDVRLDLCNDLDVWVNRNGINQPSILNPAGANVLTPNFMNATNGDGSATLNIRGGCPPYFVLWASASGTYKACVDSTNPCSKTPTTVNLTQLGARGYSGGRCPNTNGMGHREFEDVNDVDFEAARDADTGDFTPIGTPQNGTVRVMVIDSTGCRCLLCFPIRERALDCSNRSITIATTTPSNPCDSTPTGSATFNLTNLTYPLVRFKLLYYGICPSTTTSTTYTPPPPPSHCCQCGEPEPGSIITVGGNCIKCNPYFTKFICLDGLAPPNGLGPAPDNNGVLSYTVNGLCVGCWTVEIIDCSGCTTECDFVIEEDRQVPTIKCSVKQPPSCGKNNGEITVTVNGGCNDRWVDVEVGGTTIRIVSVTGTGTGSQTLTLKDLAADTYVLTVRDSLGSTASCRTTLTEVDTGCPDVEEPVIGQPSCSNNGSIGVNIVSASYPLVATLYANEFKSVICVDAKPPATPAPGNNAEPCPCNTLTTPATDITFNHLGPGCYTLELTDVCGTRRINSILLSNCKTPLHASMAESMLESGVALTFTYSGGNGRILVQLAGPICLCKVYDATECGVEVEKTINEPILPDGRYSLTLTDQCNQRCTLHFQVGSSTDNGGIGCCPVVTDAKCLGGAKKGPFDVYLVKVGDC